MKQAIVRLKRPVACLAAVFLLLTGCSSGRTPDTYTAPEIPPLDEEFSRTVRSSSGYEAAARGGRTLLVDGTTGTVTVRDASGEWKTNPTLSPEEENGGQNIDLLRSQFSLTYYRLDDGLPITANSYLDCIAKEHNQVEYYAVENGIGIRYLVGDKPVTALYPSVISEKRFQEFLDKMGEDDRFNVEYSYSRLDLSADHLEEKDRKLLLDNFPQLAGGPLYVLGGEGVGNITPGSVLSQDIERAFTAAGYTAAELQRDNTENHVKTAEEKDYSILLSMEYRLDGNGMLSVRIPKDSILYDSRRLVLTEIAMLPYFGAAGTGQEGYLFVPDGAGALIYLNNGKTGMPFFQKAYYTRDRSVPLEELDDADDYDMLLPVYGMKAGDRSFLTVIAQGDPMAALTADVAGGASRYNHLYPTFTLKQRHTVTTSVLNLSGNVTYQKTPVSSDMELHFLFQEGRAADYVGMARAYQSYLVQRGDLPAQAPDAGEMPLYLDVVGAVPCRTTRFGIPVETEKELTGYRQAIDILKAFQEKGAGDLMLGYTGWHSRGVYNSLPDKVRLIDALGGKKAFAELSAYVKEAGIPFYPKNELAYVSKNTLTDSFRISRDTARNMEQATALDGDFNLVTGTNLYETFRWVVSPGRYDSLMNRFLDSYQGYGITGLDLGSLAGHINSDFNEASLIDRVQAQAIIRSQYKKAADAGYRIAVENAAAYALAHASVAVGCPQSTSFQYIVDEAVPFYQIVLQGRLAHAGEAINLSEDYRTAALRAMETGAMPFYRFIYHENTALMGTDYELYSACYTQWLDDALELYHQAAPLYKAIGGSPIVSRRTAAPEVYETVFENGTAILVNYGDEPSAVDGQEVGAMQAVLKEGTT